jgi:hypothetical protein
MARPAAPVTLNTGNAIGNSVNRCWLVTSDSDVVDLKSTGPALVRTASPAYVNDADIGPSFAGTGYCQAVESATLVSATGFRTGVIFKCTATKAQGSGVEALFTVGGNAVEIGNGSPLLGFVIDDGTMGYSGSAAGKLVAIFRPQNYGTMYYRAGPVVQANTTYFATYRLSQWSDLLSVNDVDYAGTGLGGGSWGADIRYANLGCYDAYNSTAQWPLAATTRIACAWHDTNGATDVSDVQAKAWSADGWAMFSGGGGGVTVKKVIANVVNASGSLLPNLANIKWAFFDQTTPNALQYPVNVGTAEGTDGSGQIEVLVPNSTLSNGGVGYLILSDTDGTVSQSPSANSFAGPVTVTVTVE